MMFAKEESVVGTEQDGGVVDDLLSLELLPYRAHVPVVVLDASVVVFHQFFERSWIVAEDLGVADLVVGIGDRARFSRIAFHDSRQMSPAWVSARH